MILKEAYRYQNYLTELSNAAIRYLGTPSNVTVISQEHLRSAAHQDAKDEVTTNEADRQIKVPIMKIIAFALDILKEKEEVAKAIDSAKIIYAPSVDRDISLNRSRYSLMNTLKYMAALKNTERITQGTAYCFNAEGSQVPYRYDIKQTTRIDFDRNEVRRLINEISGKSDEASNNADYLLNSVTVAIDPRFNIHDSFEDALESFCKEDSDDNPGAAE